MKMIIERQFGKRIMELSWAEAKFAIAKGWMQPGVAVDLAIKALESDDFSQEEAELAALGYSDQTAIADNLEALCPGSFEMDNDKWAKIFVAWLYEHRAEIENPIQSLEMLWADFEYLETIEPLANQYSHKESPHRNLESEWKKFLDDKVYSILVSAHP